MIGQCQKIETLSDGSAKLSIYVKKEDLAEAVQFSFAEVQINLPVNETRSDSLERIANSADTLASVAMKLVELAKEEMGHVPL